MQHTINIHEKADEVGPQIHEMVKAIETCVHCGFCLATCPTYQVLGQEMDSPRGRIVLMKSVLEGQLPLEDTVEYLDRCLGCLACVTACPSGVRYGELITPFRAYARGRVAAPIDRRMQRAALESTLPYPGRFRSALSLGKIAKPFHSITPRFLRSMLDLLPDRLPEFRHLPDKIPAQGERIASVALLVGCVQEVLAPEINWATIRVLSNNGIEVVIPKHQVCCGALSLHTGEQEQARKFARHNLEAFPQDVDFILTNAAGCGSGMHEYPLLFKGYPEEEQAIRFSAKVRDISQFLQTLDLHPARSLSRPLKAAYHDACHLTHAQGITMEPRRLLGAVPNLTLVEISNGAICCGSAGSYNVEQPEIANELGRRKVENILKSGAEAVITGNIGCMVQLRAHFQKIGVSLPVYHTVEILDLAYSGT